MEESGRKERISWGKEWRGWFKLLISVQFHARPARSLNEPGNRLNNRLTTFLIAVERNYDDIRARRLTVPICSPDKFAGTRKYTRI